MKIAVPVWEDRIAPVLDTADSFIVYDIEHGVIDGKRDVYIGLGSLREKAVVLGSHGDILVCGALSHDMEMFLAAVGMAIEPWLMGAPELVVLMIAAGETPGPSFIMPGLGGQWRSRRGT